MSRCRGVQGLAFVARTDNSNMANHGPDPPETLAAASEKFSKFLAAQGYPDKIR